MAHPVRNSLLLCGLLGALYGAAPARLERHLPPVPVAEVGAGGGTLVVDLLDGASEADLQAVEAVIGADLDWVSPLSVDEALALGEVPDLRRAIDALASHPLVEVVEPLMELSLPQDAPDVVDAPAGGGASFPNDPLYERQWNLRAMGAPEGWSRGHPGEGVIVAVVDTGITQVEDLEGTRILPGATFVPGTRTAEDDQGHGTHVAGTIAQTTHNGKGVAGVAPGATLLPVKVLSRFGFGNSAWIASGIDYAVDQGAQVINLSLGGGYSAVIHNAIKKARAAGVIVVAAAGNSGRRGVGYPGALAETIGVSAVGPDGRLAPYSSWGKGVDIAAPGGDKRVRHGGILQDTIDGNGGHHYAEYQGTSMATPHVAGAAAVLLSRGLPPDAVEEVLLRTARGDGWDERLGHGTLDLAAALGSEAVGERPSPTLFILGGLFAGLLATMARTSTAFRLKSTAVGALAGGGLFVLGYLPLPDVWVVRLLANGIVRWPGIIFGNGWMHFPLWLSAALPLALAVTLGAYHRTRPWVLGIVAGFGAALLHGALHRTLAPWWMPSVVGQLWLVGHGLLTVLIGMGLAGTEALERLERRR